MPYLLRNVLAMGRGSLEEKNAAPPPSPPSPWDTSPEWCKCNVCRPMPNEIENVCCKRVTCITRFRHSTISALTRTSLKFPSRFNVTSRQMILISPWRVSGKLPINSFVLWRFSLRSWRDCKRTRNKVLAAEPTIKRAAKPREEWGEGL